ncbi:MAG TPA: RluA family pseudouridine synthase [Candidatus Eisenbergiella merdipullorum]|uniref:RNA pseudouridylate synthase n=1 Tax=Candidatus Eisenbergiella merdipullorum TaxID=2838553 RepID=A0A9D2I4R2_9FIRM|nr:RluA family pseudouridine synthase [Candidatus Eisenbergiella merdipullorum]
MKTKILAEDDQILVCFKPAGLAVQSARPGEVDMVSELKNYLAASQKKQEPRKRGKTAPYLGLVHRLDQPVSGILVFAKTPGAAAALSRQASGSDASENGAGKAACRNHMEKEYRALVFVEEGAFLPEPGTERALVDFLKKEPGQNLSRVVPAGTTGAKRASLSFRTVEEAGEAENCYASLSVRLHTGRHHQIRVQLAHAGLPLLGDARYGSARSREASARLGIRSICLCACRLCFYHPVTGERMEFKTTEYPWTDILTRCGKAG